MSLALSQQDAPDHDYDYRTKEMIIKTLISENEYKDISHSISLKYSRWLTLCFDYVAVSSDKKALFFVF